MSVTTRVRDLGIGRLKADVAELAASKITVGWQGPSGDRQHPEAHVSIATIANYHEHGTRHMPARPIVRITYERHSAEFRDALKRQVSLLVDGRVDIAGAVEGIGVFGVTQLRGELERSREWAKPLAQSTIDAKGNDHPLIDTGAMRDAASWAQRAGALDGPIVRQGGDS